MQHQKAKTVGDEGKMMAITAGVKHKTGLWKSLRKNGVRTMKEFLDRADQYIKLETAEGNLGKSSPDSKKNGSKKENIRARMGQAAAKRRRTRGPKSLRATIANGRSTSSTSPSLPITQVW